MKRRRGKNKTFDARAVAIKKEGLVESNMPCGVCGKPILIKKGVGGRFVLYCPGHRIIPIIPGTSSLIDNAGKKLTYEDLLKTG